MKISYGIISQISCLGNKCDEPNTNKKMSLYTAVGENNYVDNYNYKENADSIVSKALMGSYSHSNRFIGLVIVSALIAILMLFLYYCKHIVILETTISRVQNTNPMTLNRGK